MKDDSRNYPTNSAGKRKFSKKPKSFLFLLIILVLLSVALGISYAYWKYNSNQINENITNSACIEIALISETEAITLQKAHPISNTEGEKLNPYTFSIKNTCNNTLDYNVALEVLESTARMGSNNIAIKIDDKFPKLLTEYTLGVPTYLENSNPAVESYILENGRIKGGETITHHLRLWIHESSGNESQNKEFLSKITINATTPNEILTTPRILIYKDEELLKEIESKEENQEYRIYSDKEVKVLASGFSNSNKLFYSEEQNGERNEISTNEFTITPSLEGTIRYIFVEDSNNYVKLVITNKDDVTPPIISGGSETYAKNHTIRIETPGTATAEVSHYEYFISDTDSIPAQDVTAQNTSGDQEINREGTNYIFYRTVSKAGNKSDWSNSQKVNIFYRASSVTYTNPNDSSINNAQEVLDKLYELFK